LAQYRLAKEVGVSQRRIGEIVQGARGITVDTALRLAAFFGTDAQSWINLQTVTTPSLRVNPCATP
jgi:addiction module HigA family antidote